jgi:hypothetical protein
MQYNSGLVSRATAALCAIIIVRVRLQSLRNKQVTLGTCKEAERDSADTGEDGSVTQQAIARILPQLLR